MPTRETMLRWAQEALFAALALYAASPVWAVAHPAIQDLPQHLAAVRVLADYGDPDLAFGRYFEIQLFRTQYLAYYLAAILLSWPFGVLLANKLLISASIVGTPYALRFLLRTLGRDERLALLSIPLAWNAHLILGFLNFVAAIPLALVGLALAVKLRQRFDTTTAVLLGAVALVCFATHVVPFALLGLGAALIGLGDTWSSWERTAARWSPLVPSAIAVLLWVANAPAGRSTLSAASGGGDRGAAVFVPPARAWAEIPGWLTEVLQTPRDSAYLAAFLFLLVLAATSGARGSTRRRDPGGVRSQPRIAWLSALCVLLYFVTPASYDWIWPIHARFPLLALLFGIVALPRAQGVLGAVVLAGAVGLSVASTAEVRRAFVAIETEELGDLDGAIQAIPEGSKVAGLIFDRTSAHVKFSPFIHSVAWVQARRGGAVMFTFADFPQSPFVFREDNRPPRVGPRWEWLPDRVDPVDDLAWYDYLLVRVRPGASARRVERAAVWSAVWTSPRWRVYRRTPPPGTP
ncbi:MAG: hypothetical protein ACFCGT_07695 [Sandaracinaceae bacterium]